MNQNQDKAAQTGETTPAAEAPKKRRAPRKTAAAVVAPAVAVVAMTDLAPPEVAPVAAATETAIEATAPVAAEEAPAVPKKRRAAPRKTVAATEAAKPAVPVPVEVVAAPETAPATPARAPRSRKKVVVVEVASEPAPVSTQVSASVEPVVAPQPTPVSTEPVAAVAPAPAVAVAVVAVAALAGEPEVTAVGVAPDGERAEAAPAAEGEGAESGRRRGRDRDRKGRRERRGPREDGGQPGADTTSASASTEPVSVSDAGDAGDDEAIEILVGFDDDDSVDTGALFAEVVSGEYDVEAEPAEEEIVEAGKRVLRPEPEAPKLHKVLAQAGIGSRREMEQLIEDGQVSVNGEPAHIGMRIAQGDQIRLAGRPIKVRIAPPPARVLAYHKPTGEVVTHHDPEGRPTVFRHLPRLPTGKWLSVGRLDINTEGLLLFTNSGDLANQLMHPRFGVEREYAVRVLGSLTTEQRAKLLDGVEVEGQKAAFKSIEDGGGEGVNHWYRVVITEGRNREVRKLFDTVGLAVSRLIRIRYGTVVLPRGLKRGVWVELDDQDVRAIRQIAGNDPGRDAQSRDGQREQRGGSKKPGRSQGQGQGQGQQGGRDRDNQAPRSRGAQHGGDRGGDRQERQNQQGQGQDRGDRQGNGRPAGGPQGQGGQNKQRGPRQDAPPVYQGQGPQGGGRGPRGGGGEGDHDRDRDGVDDPLHIPNPLEQTFDKRFVSGSKRITTGFGRPTEEPTPGSGGNRSNKGGPRQPDPMQTSVGYIGAEAYFTRPGGGNNKGRGGRRR